MNIAVLLERLIMKKYYESKEDIENKLSVFFAMSKINAEDYSELVLKADEMYKIETEEEIETDIVEEEQEEDAVIESNEEEE